MSIKRAAVVLVVSMLIACDGTETHHPDERLFAELRAMIMKAKSYEEDNNVLPKNIDDFTGQHAHNVLKEASYMPIKVNSKDTPMVYAISKDGKCVLIAYGSESFVEHGYISSDNLELLKLTHSLAAEWIESPK